MNNKCFNSDYAYFYDLIYQGKDYKKETDFLEKLFKKYCGIKPRDILDIGCGTGNHALEFVKKGYNITGIDVSRDMIEIARNKFEKLNLNGRLMVKNISNWQPRVKFDVVISMFAVINYITDISSLLKIFVNIHNMLRNNGLFIFECWNAYKVAKSMSPSSLKEIQIDIETKIIRTGKIKVNKLKQLCTITYEIKKLKNNSVIRNYSETHNIKFYYPGELENYLALANLKLVKIYPSFITRQKIDDEKFHLIYIAKK